MFSLNERKLIISTFESDDTRAIEKMHEHLAQKIIRFLKSNSVSIKQMDSIFISALTMDNSAKAMCFKRPYQRMINRKKTSCLICGSTKKLESHHIKPISDYPELRYDPTNIMVVCNTCHDIIHDRAKTSFYDDKFYRRNCTIKTHGINHCRGQIMERGL